MLPIYYIVSTRITRYWLSSLTCVFFLSTTKRAPSSCVTLFGSLEAIFCYHVVKAALNIRRKEKKRIDHVDLGLFLREAHLNPHINSTTMTFGAVLPLKIFACCCVYNSGSHPIRPISQHRLLSLESNFRRASRFEQSYIARYWVVVKQFGSTNMMVSSGS